ncbi:MAG: hypothetical protein GY862_27245 [Gammaproteobacteria bacterium]|nr:hypothetical protein [Gammaproteobacteria bacterium]
MAEKTKGDKKSLHVHYAEKSALYASQFIANVSEEEIIINFSSGIIPDPATGENHLPIHTRIALSPKGAKKLATLLTQVSSQGAAQKTAPAKLPKSE